MEKKGNILGETSVLVTKYEKSGTVEPYYAEKGDPSLSGSRPSSTGGLVLDDCNTDVVEVKLWEAETSGAFPRHPEKAVIGSPATAATTPAIRSLQHPLHRREGNGTFNPTTKAFTAAVSPASKRRARAHFTAAWGQPPAPIKTGGLPWRKNWYLTHQKSSR